MSIKIKIAIDASRCRSGGAIAHLVGILQCFDAIAYPIGEIHLWSYKKLLNSIPDFVWLKKHNPPALEKGLPAQLYWQTFSLSKEVKENHCDILFTADASTLCRSHPQVILSQDMLSYEPGIMRLFGYGKSYLRLLSILWLQNSAFKRADGVIFLTHYARKVIEMSCGKLPHVAIIPHGIGDDFHQISKEPHWPQRAERPIRCLYISNAELYKHQWEVIRAVEELRKQKIDIVLKLVGGGTGKAQDKVISQRAISDPHNIFVDQEGFIAQSQLPSYLQQADIFIFASSCENMPITLLEAMAAGLPIACSDRGPMPEVLKDGGIYFDPENPVSIAEALKKLIDDPVLREQFAAKAKNISKQYSWARCADETWRFIVETVLRLKNG